MKLLRPLYGLAQSGEYWHAEFSKHLTHELGIKVVASEMSLFFRRTRGKISSILPYYVDDTLACGDNTFAELTNSREIRNESKAKQGHEISGVYVDKCDNGFEIHQ